MESVLQHYRIRPRPRLQPATAQHSARPNSHVSFFCHIVTQTLVYNDTKPTAKIGTSLCADSGCLTILVTETLASEATLPNLRPSKMRVKTANGGILRVKEKTKVPFGLSARNKSNVFKDGTLVDLLCNIKPMADAGLISIFHPGNEGFTSYQRPMSTSLILRRQSSKDTKKTNREAQTSGKLLLHNPAITFVQDTALPSKHWPQTTSTMTCRP